MTTAKTHFGSYTANILANANFTSNVLLTCALCVLQHNQWICLTTERRAQNFPLEGSIASAQSQITQCLPSTGESTRELCVKNPKVILQVTFTIELVLHTLDGCSPEALQSPFVCLTLHVHTLNTCTCCCTAGLLCGAVFGKGQHSNRAGMCWIQIS